MTGQVFLPQDWLALVDFYADKLLLCICLPGCLILRAVPSCPVTSLLWQNRKNYRFFSLFIFFSVIRVEWWLLSNLHAQPESRSSPAFAFKALCFPTSILMSCLWTILYIVLVSVRFSGLWAPNLLYPWFCKPWFCYIYSSFISLGWVILCGYLS